MYCAGVRSDSPGLYNSVNSCVHRGMHTDTTFYKQKYLLYLIAKIYTKVSRKVMLKLLISITTISGYANEFYNNILNILFRQK